MSNRLKRAAIWLLGAICAISLAAPAANAAIGSQLLRFGQGGSGAGELRFGDYGGGISTNPSTGHVFIADTYNHRVSEFTAWGEFVRAWGWGVRTGASEFQICTDATGCQKGKTGSGVGQLGQPTGIAVDPSGNVFVFDSISQRVQKFSSSGSFLLMLGGGVNSTTGADICTAADVTAGDVCAGGSTGVAPGEFSRLNATVAQGDNLEIGSDGALYVGDRGRIEAFNLDGTFKGQLAFSAIAATEPAFPEGREVGSLSIDPVTGDFLVAFPSSAISIDGDVSVWRVADDGAVVPPAPLVSTFPDEAEQLFAGGVTADQEGNVLLAADPKSEFSDLPPRNPRILQFDPAGSIAGECCLTPANGTAKFTYFPALASSVVTAAGAEDLYIAGYTRGSATPEDSFVEVRGPAPDLWPPPTVPPTIESQVALSVGTDSASVRAQINPNFWDDTRYFLEYGTSDCELGGCAKVPAPPGDLLTDEIVKRGILTEPIELTGLSPNATYHYRFVAASSGGGPTEGTDRTFKTFSSATPKADCANQKFRSGQPSAGLFDCRAYEMVSPVDKAGGDILTQCNSVCVPARLNQAAMDGNGVTYSSYRSFGDAESASYSTQYLARRQAEGWLTHGISPPREGPSVYDGTRPLDSQYKAFTPDLSSGWFVFDTAPLLASGAVPDYANLYRRDNDLDSYETLTTVAPAGTGASDYNLEVQGISADGELTVFRANGKLTPNASAVAEISQLYEASNGELRLVSVKPNGTAMSTGSTVGASSSGSIGSREANLTHAVSEDGTKIYWTDSVGSAGKIYVRIEAAVTLQVSPGNAIFWAATPDGKRAIYAEEGVLKRFDLTTEESTTLAASTDVTGVLGQSADLSRIYFVSTATLAGGATAGEPNLFFYEDGQPLQFVATLSSEDFITSRPSPAALSPRKHFARVSQDGLSTVFMSRAALTGAENVDQVSGERDAEVFRFDASSDDLVCLSCSPAGVSPSGTEYRESEAGYWYASSIPGWEMQLHAPRAISTDGDRVFFNSFNRLVAADANQAQDVYSWQAPGEGECNEAMPQFSASAAGCVTLISGGASDRDAEFVDASADGRDVFFLTGESLVSWDPGQIDLYDARVLGGFAGPPSIPAECEGETCQPQGNPPPTPAAPPSQQPGPGNPKPPVKCKKGFVKKKGKCVKKHKGKGKKSSKGKNKNKKKGGSR